MGVVGATQSVAEVRHPPQEPLPVQTSEPPHCDDVEHALQPSVVGSQTGVCPLHPALVFDGSQVTHLLPTHSVLPSLRPAQSVKSRHSTQRADEDDDRQKLSAPLPEQGRFEAGSHSQVRPEQDFASVVEHGVPQLWHSSTEVFRHAGPFGVLQQSSSASHPSWVARSHAAGVPPVPPAPPVLPPAPPMPPPSPPAPPAPEPPPIPLSTSMLPPEAVVVPPV